MPMQMPHNESYRLFFWVDANYELRACAESPSQHHERPVSQILVKYLAKHNSLKANEMPFV